MNICDERIGFIGTGNMGQAMIGGILKSGMFSSRQIIVSDLDTEKLEHTKEIYGVEVTTDSSKVALESDIIILAVKPDKYDVVMKNIKNSLDPKKIIVTIAAGKDIASIEKILGEKTKVIRTMPNTPSLVNEGMTALSPNKNITEDEISLIKKIFESFGKAEILPESLIDAVIGVSASAPAYVFILIESMADAAVMEGMPRDKAYKFASQAVLGAAKMVLLTGKHPGELKDMVCSPGGTTIEAVAYLEKNGFRTAIIESIRKCIEKSKLMTNEN